MALENRCAPEAFAAKLSALRGASAAVVYGFSAQATPTKVWYDQWRSDVISAYGRALERLGVHPLFLDVDTFCRQALAGTLPPLIGAFNPNAGITPIHHWCVVPAVAGWCGIEPFPAHADVLIAGERKDLASLVARSAGLNGPDQYDAASLAELPADREVIVKPRDLGGSVGVERVAAATARGMIERDPTIIVQAFVPGFDLTVPVVFQPSEGKHRAPACVLYMPDGPDPQRWMHDRATKTSNTGYRKLVVKLPEPLEQRISHFAAKAQLGAYSRVDLRISSSCDEWEDARFWEGDLAFLEVNPLPTLRQGINFLNVVASEPFGRAFAPETDVLRRVTGLREEDVSLELVLAIAMCTKRSVQSQV